MSLGLSPIKIESGKDRQSSLAAFINIPDAQTVRAVDPGFAKARYLEHVQAFQRMKGGGSAAPVGDQPASGGGDATDQDRGQVEAATPEAAAPEQDQVRISSEPVDAAADQQTAEARAKADERARTAALEENVAALENAAASTTTAQAAEAGIKVAMVTGDHPVTALAVAREVGLADNPEEVTTGAEILAAAEQSEQTLDALCQQAKVFARVEPQQKLQIVQSLQRQGHFVAVTGDGANDAPALRAAQVGIAMGKRGTDVAKETSDIVITDDNFASIVAGVAQGRLAYANVRKVIFLLISTGAAEVILFSLSLMAGLPMPLLAVQLLWLNLVTNGIQDVALAFEPAQGDELKHSPRPPNQGVFDRVMVQRVLLSAATMGVVAFAVYYWLLSAGWHEDAARNLVLLLMVLFENLHVFNSRSETKSMFLLNPLRNRLLLFSVLGAQALHLQATPIWTICHLQARLR